MSIIVTQAGPSEFTCEMHGINDSAITFHIDTSAGVGNWKIDGFKIQEFGRCIFGESCDGHVSLSVTNIFKELECFGLQWNTVPSMGDDDEYIAIHEEHIIYEKLINYLKINHPDILRLISLENADGFDKIKKYIRRTCIAFDGIMCPQSGDILRFICYTLQA